VCYLADVKEVVHRGAPGMSFEERYTWVYAGSSAVGFAVYVVLLLTRARGGPLSEVPYEGLMLWSIGGAMLAALVGRIGIAAAYPQDADKKDQRDLEIDRFGDYIGQSFVAVGGVGALALAMVEVDHFWIANMLYLCFFLATVLSSTAKLFAYRVGLPSW
jgi:hypothetical protein